MTLHRLLQITKVDEVNYIKEDLSIEPIDADVIIVDEVSMIDLALMKYLLTGVYEGTKLVLVGINVITLDKIFRQAAASKIVLNAHRVNSGEYFIDDKEGALKKDFFFVDERSPERIMDFVLSLYKDGLKKFEGYQDFKSVQIITPSKKGMVGTREINKMVQELVNPNIDKKKEKQVRCICI